MNKNLITLFSENNIDVNDYKNLMFDYSNNELEGVSKKEANDKFRAVSFAILDLDPNKKPTHREIRRALRKHGAEWFEVHEDIIDQKIDTGWHENEWFNEFVDNRNIANGDSQEFYSEQKTLLSVVKTAGAHHDISVQRLGEGTSFTVPLSIYTIAVGDSIELFLLGRKDMNDLTDAIASAFLRKIQGDMYAAVMSASNQVPPTAQFNKTMAISTATKDTFDELLEDVQMVSASDVVIMGTKMALKKLNAFCEIDWRSDDLKKTVNDTGRIGNYEGTMMVEIPQRFADQDVSKKLVDNKKLLIIPRNGDKFVKFIDRGETEITEVNEKGARMDDTNFLQYERAMGCAVQLGSYIGSVTITN